MTNKLSPQEVRVVRLGFVWQLLRYVTFQIEEERELKSSSEMRANEIEYTVAISIKYLRIIVISRMYDRYLTEVCSS